MSKPSKYLLVIPGRLSPPRPVDSFEEASRVFSELRDASGEGASTWPDGFVNDYGLNVARLSYNGKVWEPGDWKPGDRPLFDPYASPVA